LCSAHVEVGKSAKIKRGGSYGREGKENGKKGSCISNEELELRGGGKEVVKMDGLKLRKRKRGISQIKTAQEWNAEEEAIGDSVETRLVEGKKSDRKFAWPEKKKWEKRAGGGGWVWSFSSQRRKMLAVQVRKLHRSAVRERDTGSGKN